MSSGLNVGTFPKKEKTNISVLICEKKYPNRDIELQPNNPIYPQAEEKKNHFSGRVNLFSLLE